MKSKPDRTRNTRAAKFRAKSDGSAQVNTQISPDAAARLAIIRSAESMTLRQAIESAILNYPINGSSVTTNE